MSMRKRYDAQNKTSIRQLIILIVACFLLVFFLAFSPTFAGFVTGWTERMDKDVAQWNIKINGVPLSDDSVANTIKIELVPDTGIISEHPEKITAGQTGHFDVSVDPSGTEVSFSYAVVIDTENSKLPKGMNIDGYSVNDGEIIYFTKDDDKSVNGYIALTDGNAFTDQDTVNIRFYWTWSDERFDEFSVYDIVVTATVWQHGATEGAQTL